MNKLLLKIVVILIEIISIFVLKELDQMNVASYIVALTLGSFYGIAIMLEDK